MNTDHDFDGLYDLRDLQDSDAWFTDAAARSLGASDPLSPSVIAMLERLDRELASLAPVDRGTITALITGLNEPPLESPVAHRPPRRAARHARRNLIVVGVTGVLLVAAGGVAAASPGSFFYPVREAAFGGAQEHAVPESLADVESELDRIEVRIGEAQQAGGITESARTALARRIGTIHPILERASGDQADALRTRWTRDDLVLISLPHLGDQPPPLTPTLAPTPPPDGTVSAEPTPSTTPSASHDGGATPASPRAHPSQSPQPHGSHSAATPGAGHDSPAATPTPSASHSHDDGENPTSTPTPERTKSPKPTPTSTAGSGTGGSGTGGTQGKND